MAVITGCHVIEKGDINKARVAAASILKHGLEVRNAPLGTAAYAYYIDLVPRTEHGKPMVIFDVDSKYVQKFEIWHPRNPDYAIVIMPGREFSYIPIKILGFRDLQGFAPYNGSIGFF